MYNTSGRRVKDRWQCAGGRGSGTPLRQPGAAVLLRASLPALGIATFPDLKRPAVRRSPRGTDVAARPRRGDRLRQALVFFRCVDIGRRVFCGISIPGLSFDLKVKARECSVFAAARSRVCLCLLIDVVNKLLYGRRLFYLSLMVSLDSLNFWCKLHLPWVFN